MLSTRIITGTLLIASLIGLVWVDTMISVGSIQGGILLMGIFAVVLIPLAGREAAAMLGRCDVAAPMILVATVALWMFGSAIAAGWLSACNPVLAIYLALLAAPVGLATALIAGSWGGRIKGAWTGAGSVLGVATWIGLGSAFWIIACAGHSTWLVAALLLVVKMGDNGAYFTALLIARHKLIPWLSPGKTIEGLLGGLVLASIAGAVLALLSRGSAPENELCIVAGAVGGLLLALTGALGDLAESLLKRAADIKDSGRIIPGMGGVLDVLDSPLAAGPIAFMTLVLGTAG